MIGATNLSIYNKRSHYIRIYMNVTVNQQKPHIIGGCLLQQYINYGLTWKLKQFPVQFFNGTCHSAEYRSLTIHILVVTAIAMTY